MSLDNFADQLQPIKLKALSLVDRATQQATSIDDRIVDGIDKSIHSRFDVWLTHHPLITWLVNHPITSLIASLIAIILAVRLIITIYRAIASTIDRVWLAILRSPVRLLKFLFGWQPKSKMTDLGNTTITNYEVTQDSVQLEEIMTRLNLIQQQQQQIMQDLAQLKEKPLAIEPKQLRKIEPKQTK